MKLIPFSLLAIQLAQLQKEIPNKLIVSYLLSMPADIVKKRFEKLTKKDLDGAATLFRANHITFIFKAKVFNELNNSQNNSMHIHEVWRDFNDDYGLKFLRECYQNSQHLHIHEWIKD